MEKSTRVVQRLVGRKIYYDFNVHTIANHNIYEQVDGSYVTALATKDGNWFMFRGLDPFGARSTVKLLDFCKFDINYKRGVITAIVGWKGRTYAGTAVYNPKDHLDPAFGRQLALYRALVDPSATAIEVEELVGRKHESDAGEDNTPSSEDNTPSSEDNEVRKPNEADEVKEAPQSGVASSDSGDAADPSNDCP